MLRTSLCATAFAAAAGIALPLTAPATFAAAGQYRFEMVSAHPTGPDKTDVLLRLTRLTDAKPVAGAIIFQSQAVMAGMEGMPGAAVVEPGQQPGTYVFHVTVSMAGPWTLQVAAKVQGETETLRASVPFQAGD